MSAAPIRLRRISRLIADAAKTALITQATPYASLRGLEPLFVIAGLDPAIYLVVKARVLGWMRGSSRA
jgi:hypothetical protein